MAVNSSWNFQLEFTAPRDFLHKYNYNNYIIRRSFTWTWLLCSLERRYTNVYEWISKTFETSDGVDGGDDEDDDGRQVDVPAEQLFHEQRSGIQLSLEQIQHQSIHGTKISEDWTRLSTTPALFLETTIARKKRYINV